MAESVVTFLIKKLSGLVEGELKLLGGVKQEFVFIRDELESIRAFLKVADAMEEANPELQIWVKQIKDVSHDIEDHLDEFIMLQQSARHHHQQHRFFGYFRKISQQIKSMKAQRQITSEMKDIKVRVINTAERHGRYAIGTTAFEQQCFTSSNAWYDQRGDALLLEEPELVGIQKPKQDLIHLLIDGGDSCLKVISIVGMGGLGKTTLAKKVYDDAQVEGHFQIHAWVTVSQSLNIQELLIVLIRVLFEEARQPPPQSMETMDVNQLKALVKGFLQKGRYVLVLDDIWDINVWNAIKYVLPNRDCGSRILITTRMLDVASISCLESHGDVYKMEPLSPEESWTLFCKKAFQEKECPSHLQCISKNILSKCEGLPLAIVAIGGVLASKTQVGMDEWEVVKCRIGSKMEGNDKLRSLKKILLLGYSDLPYYLKSCFLYLSGFPENQLIEGYRLIRLWIAEGFVERKEGKTLEEVAEAYLFELVRRSLVQVVETTIDGRLRSFRLHDFLREIVLSKSREENFLQVVGDQGNESWTENVRRLSIHNTSQNISQGNCLFSRLRSLLMFGVQGPPQEALMPLLFNGGGLKLLKTLELRDTALEIIPDELFSLFHLRYLGLRRTNVKRLPKCIRKLESLETLDLKDTYVTELPAEILMLKQLRHLLVYRYMSGPYRTFQSICYSKAPSKLGGLQSLQKLCYIEANTILVKEIGKLTQLRRLGITKLRGEDGVALCSSIENLTNLRSLSLISTEEDEILDLQSLSRGATPFLRALYLRGRLEKLPHWITSLHGLVRLNLRWSKLRDDPLQSIQDLPNLVQIHFGCAYEGEELCFRAGGFRRLKFLYIVKLERLTRVIVENGAMPNLEELIIQDCKSMEELPSGIELLTNLKLLVLGDMADTLISKLNRDVPSGDYLKIAHIPQVWIGDTKQGQWRGNFLSR